MTEAGNRILNRTTKVTHVPTGTVIIVDNTNIPTDAPPRTHRQQRDKALEEMADKIGADVNRNQCRFEFIVT